MAFFPDPPAEEAPTPEAQEPDGGAAPTASAGNAAPPGSEVQTEPGQLLDEVLNPLLDDFADTFARGLFLLERCPDRVLPGDRREALRGRLTQAQAALAAARALRAASSTPMALDMAIIQPWHALVVEVWSLSAAMRAAGGVDLE